MVIRVNRYIYWILFTLIATPVTLYILGTFSLFNAVMTFLIILALTTSLHLIIELIFHVVNPEFFEYNEDIFYDVKWKWDWNLDKQVLNLRPFCPHCEKELYSTFDTLLNQTEFVCTVCDKQIANVNSSNRNFVPDSVKKSIVRKLKKEDSSF